MKKKAVKRKVVVEIINPPAPPEPPRPQPKIKDPTKLPKHLQDLLSVVNDPHGVNRQRARAEIKKICKERFGYSAAEIDRWLNYLTFQGFVK